MYSRKQFRRVSFEVRSTKKRNFKHSLVSSNDSQHELTRFIRLNIVDRRLKINVQFSKLKFRIHHFRFT